MMASQESDLMRFLRPPKRNKDIPKGTSIVEFKEVKKPWTHAKYSGLKLERYTLVAVKKAQSSEDNVVIQQEFELLKECRCDNIVVVYYLDKSISGYSFVMEAAERSLCDFLHTELCLKQFPTATDDTSSGYTMRRCLDWLWQIANGMAYLHCKNIIHRDVKSANVLLFCKVQPRTICKVCDLDASRRDDEEVKSGSKGTGPYRAPEIKLHESEYTKKVDNFSYGVLTLECLKREDFRSRPEASTVSEQFKESVFKKQMDDKYKFKDLKDMIVKLLSEQPENRPDFEAIKDSLLDMRGEELNVIMHALRMSEEQKNTGEANVTGLESGTQQTSSPCVISANKTD